MGDKDDRARGELITVVEAIGFYDGLSFGQSVVRQFFKLYNLSLPKLDLGSRTILTPTVIKDTPPTFDFHHKLSRRYGSNRSPTLMKISPVRTRPVFVTAQFFQINRHHVTAPHRCVRPSICPSVIRPQARCGSTGPRARLTSISCGNESG